MSNPVFAVVGHPNKGKSCIVATLAQDEAVQIASDAGTTMAASEYPMAVDGQVLFTLVDTPGFQRARAALAWMKQRETTAAEHPRIVRAFVSAHDRTHCAAPFYEECQLLRPIVNGAGILYVVDGSVPYAPEFDPEMEILRWTGRPSLALINPIGAADHVDCWRNALGQYFKVVRVFDAVIADFDKRIDLLRAFGQLDESWQKPLGQAVDLMLSERRRQAARAARAVGELLVDVLTHSESVKLRKDEAAASHRERLEKRYLDALRAKEKRCRQDVERCYQHDRLERDEADFEWVDQDLFNQKTWLAFGLRRGDLVTAGAASGALAGGVIDAAVGGTSFLAGAAVGTAAGAAAAWLGAGRMSRFTVLNRPLGGKRLVCGPTKNINFPFVMLGRARLHHQGVADRTHARRDPLLLTDKPMNPLPDEQRKTLVRLFERIRKAAADADKLGDLTDELAQLVEGLFS